MQFLTPNAKIHCIYPYISACCGHLVFEQLANVDKAIGVGFFTNLQWQDCMYTLQFCKMKTKLQHAQLHLSNSNTMLLAAQIILEDAGESHTGRPP